MIVARRQSSVVPGDLFRIVVLGDSLTNFGWFWPLSATMQTAQLAAGSAPPAMTTGPLQASSTQNTACHRWFNSGIAGDDCTTIIANWGGTPAAAIAARVALYKPDLVIDMIGINCMQHAIPDATCVTNHASLYAQITAQCPLAQRISLGPLCYGENWPDGANGNDAAIALKNVIVANAAAAAGSTYVDLRPHFFAYEAINNPSHANFGILLPNGDFVHPNPTGQAWISNEVAQVISYG